MAKDCASHPLPECIDKLGRMDERLKAQGEQLGDIKLSISSIERRLANGKTDWVKISMMATMVGIIVAQVVQMAK